jgi:hypothetical protein
MEEGQCSPGLRSKCSKPLQKADDDRQCCSKMRSTGDNYYKLERRSALSPLESLPWLLGRHSGSTPSSGFCPVAHTLAVASTRARAYGSSREWLLLHCVNAFAVLCHDYTCFKHIFSSEPRRTCTCYRYTCRQSTEHTRKDSKSFSSPFNPLCYASVVAI